ncbi:kinase C and casein kinase substrate in neurons protein 2 [Loa loa]|uniref:Kinase C and casein kinase substrate in neurons protein 2 n=1 Tax=Loa loa TaxID=7209 RepID=A0A1S0TMM8_LOALO|nr:kinase C and casein kinase substrate in neurons protein 2 [Loa loa]EFO16842.1 kinase C and casein kinase substrate in neurons protein 2 [Loa loa]
MADTTSFYDIGGYRENIRRYKDGIEQLTDVQTMIKERMDIETNYNKSLQIYYDKWSDHVDGLAKSAIQAVWKDVLEESIELQRLHANVRDRICDEILKTIALYLKENHHPSAFRASKETREVEDDFERAQRSWRRQFEKVEKAKKAYHAAARSERSAQIQMKNACGDAALSPDMQSRYHDRYQKCQDELAKSEKVYRIALEDLYLMKKNYVSHMNDVFEACQMKELKRLKFSFEMLSNLQKVCSDLASATKLNHLHCNLEKKLGTDNTRFNNDLENWSKKYGPECETKWPVFEPFIPSLGSITSRKKKKDGEVVLMKQTFKDVDGHSNSVYSIPSSVSQNAQLATPSSISTKTSIVGEAVDRTNGILSKNKTESSIKPNCKEPTSSISANPHTEQSSLVVIDVDNAGSNPSESSPTGDVKPYTAKVLHDYDAQDDDELSLKKGEKITVLSGPDHLNWSLGMKDERTGFFPASFVQKL